MKMKAAVLAVIAVILIASGAKEETPLEVISVETPQVVEREIEAVEIPVEPLTVETKWFYDVPLDLEVQTHIIRECEKYGIDPAIVIAMAYRETKFDADAIGDNGKSFGLMQIQTRWHEERMERLGVTDIMLPIQNVTVAIDYLSELLDKYGDMEMALMAYNAGSTGAYNYWFSKGIYSNGYSQEIIRNSERYKEEMIEYVLYR